VRAIIRFGGVKCTRDDWSTCPADGNITITTTIVSSEAITARKLWLRDTVSVHVRSDIPRLCRRLLIIDREVSMVGRNGGIRKNVLHPRYRKLLPEAFVTKIRLYVYDRVDNPTSFIDRHLFSVIETRSFSNKLTKLNSSGQRKMISKFTFHGKRIALDYLFSRREF